MFQLLLLKQKDKPIAIKQSGVAFNSNSLKPYLSAIGIMKKKLRASNGLKPNIKKIKPPATNVRKIANTGVKKKIALDG